MKKQTIFMLAIVVVLIVAATLHANPDEPENFIWDRAVYWDVRYPTCWASSGFLKEVFESAGYSVLNADQLKMWMGARIADGIPSVVVFCQDIAPDTVVESKSSSCTLRQYLDAGGKIVWYADIPMYYQGHSDGSRTEWGVSGSINILGLSAAGGLWDSGDEVTFTADGIRWGLTETWQSLRSAPTSGLRVLAEDDSGYAAAWVKHYLIDDSYRGFVRLFDQVGEPKFSDVQNVAEYFPFRASNPDPCDGTEFAGLDVVLSWLPGEEALSHNVYFGTDFNNVNDANTTDPNVYMGNYDVNSFDPCGLELDTTYYWRIDEVGELNTWKGDLWCFTTVPLTAYNPRPADDAIAVLVNPALRWDAGCDALSYDVYFGKSNPLPFKGNQTTAVYYPGMLPENTTYWWRIDEVCPNGIIPGELWSFTTGWNESKRIIAWNIEFLGSRDPRRTPEQITAIAERILGFDAAVLALQEIYRGSTLENIRSQLGPSWQSYYANYENALLYNTKKVEMLSVEMLDSLDNPPYTSYPWTWGTPVSGVFRPVKVYAQPFRVIGVHCHWQDPERRIAEGEWLRTKIIEFLEDPEEPNAIILLGDLNGLPGYPPHPQLQEGNYLYLLPKENGSSTHVDGWALDHCYVTQAAKDKLAKESAFVIRPEHYGETPEQFRETYSDHYPVLIGLFGYVGVAASYPTPADGASGVSTDVVLGWPEAERAGSYDVYFGTDFNDINDANTADPNVYMGNYDVNSFDPCDLVLDARYYWRIDEVNESDSNSPWKGSVWSFTTSKIAYVPDPYPTIQAAIDLAWKGVTIIVDERTHNENIKFRGKNLTLRSIDPNDRDVVAATVINGENQGSTVTFSDGEDANCVLTGFTITGGSDEDASGAVLCTGEYTSPTISNCVIAANAGTGIYCDQSKPTFTNCIIAGNAGCGISMWGRESGTITNCTVVENRAEGIYSASASPAITNCVVWGNEGDAIYGCAYCPHVTYTDVEAGYTSAYTVIGNIDVDPCFVQPGYWDANGTPEDANDDFWVEGDYHLKSQGWRLDAQSKVWVRDDVTSRCIDTGSPDSPLGDELLSVPDDPNNTWGQNLRINMGAFGGTAEASMPPYDWAILGDLTNDGKVDLGDLAAFVNYWLDSSEFIPGDFDRSRFVDMFDFALLARDWLGQTTWHE